jgi:hypothetical protein
MFTSKRFIAFVVGVLMFTTMIFLTKYPPMELAGAISVICGIYIGAETFRSSSSTS